MRVGFKMEDVEPWLSLTGANKKSSSLAPVFFERTPRYLDNIKRLPTFPSPHSKQASISRSAKSTDKKRKIPNFPSMALPTSTRKPASKTRRLSTLDKNITDLLLQELERAWDNARLSDYFKELYRELLANLPPSLISSEVSRQVQEINSGSAPVLAALKSIKAREQGLQALKNVDFSIEGAQVQSQYFLLECAEMLHEFRMLSLKVLEAVVTWRQHVYATQQSAARPPLSKKGSAVAFVWEDCNYLLKMKTDIDWVGTSSLRKYFDFAETLDPFMVRCSATTLLSNQNKTGLVVEGNAVLLPMNRQLRKRIQDAELVLAEENVCDWIKPPNFSLAMAIPAVTTPHKTYTDPFDRRIRTEYREKRPRLDYGDRNLDKAEDLDSLITRSGSKKPRKASSLRRISLTEIKAKGPRLSKLEGVEGRMGAYLSEELYEDMLQSVIEAVVYAVTMQEENETVTEVSAATFLEEATVELLRRLVAEVHDDVLAQALLEIVLQDTAFITELAAESVKAAEAETQAELEAKLKQGIAHMEAELARTLWEAVLEDCVQVEVASTARQELQDYQDEQIKQQSST
jgi:hypothetical protein